MASSSTSSSAPAQKFLDVDDNDQESGCHSETVRLRRLMKELGDLEQLSRSENPICNVELVNDNLFEWNVRLFAIDPESELARDMREQKVPCILLELTFPDDFPFSPPFMRVVSPYIEKGFVMSGGAICMELLTPQGWSGAYTVEALIMQFASTVVKGKGRIAKKPALNREYSRRTAEASFQNIVKIHKKSGWATPALADG